jgi:Ca2+-transporting ATPase
MSANNFNIRGLTNAQVLLARKKFGQNTLNYKKENAFLDALLRIIQDPMVLLLLVASFIYFISGKIGDGIFLAFAIVFQTSISLFQYSRSNNALEKLKDFSQPKCKVIRNGLVEHITSENLVIGDSLMVEEGSSIAADGIIVYANDFSVNESILTGESLSVFKDATTKDNCIYSGTTVAAGLAIATIVSIGNETKLGKIGNSLESIKEEQTPLEKQIANFVKKMAIGGGVIFIIVWAFNYWHSLQFTNSLLQSLTIAMSVLPEEIPVAFTTFMALGAWRLMKMGIVVKQMKTVETLGSATVICVDKTGTITQNNMSLAKLFVLKTNTIFNPEDEPTNEAKELLKLAMFASEPIPFDPMEIALHKAYSDSIKTDERLAYKLIHGYPLSGKPPMMTHIFENITGKRLVVAKGAPEALISVSGLSDTEKQQISEAINVLTNEGYRVLGVGETTISGANFPKTQQELHFQFKGIVAFYDPPKKNIQQVLEQFYKAGISVKIITGDNAATTMAIAKQIGFEGAEKSISGDELITLKEDELRTRVISTSVFTRMFPEAKLKIINALKAEHQIVAMTGDGVNDGPALKAAHIGIAMGKKGTEIAKQAASLILLNDDLSNMVDAIAMGRKIYTNLKKAIQYIISIHIPIILIVLTPLALGWIYPAIFSPIHIIFLEIIMGPTCSIIYENEPMEENTMTQPPRPFSNSFFVWKELLASIAQGVVITAATLFTYQYAVSKDFNESHTRTMVFVVLVTANIFLTLVNRSFYYSIITTLMYKNNLVPIIIGITAAITGMLIYLKPLTVFFEFESLTISQLLLCIVIGFVSVIWYEAVKAIARRKMPPINIINT